MTDVREASAAPAGSGSGHAGRPRSPSVPRVGRRRWVDVRALLGLVLLLASIGVGARVLAQDRSTVPVVSVTGDLPAGHVLVADDLAVTHARLEPSARGRYLAGGQVGALVGRTLARGVSSGELLAAGAVATAGAAPVRLVPVKVRDGRLPLLRVADRVDVYATVTLGAAATATAGSPGTAHCAAVAVVTDAEVAEAPTGGDSGDATVVLRVPPVEAGSLVLASELGAVDLVRHVAAGEDQGTAAPVPATALGPVPAPAACGHQ